MVTPRQGPQRDTTKMKHINSKIAPSNQMSNKCIYELFETKFNCTLTGEIKKRHGSPEHLVLKLQIYGTQQ
jgi:hypothetical protein